MIKRILALLLTLLLCITAAMAEATIEPTVTPTVEPTPEPGRLAGLVIGIDPGHQAHANSDKETIAPDSRQTKPKVSSGTEGVRTGIPEYITVLEISFKLRDALLAFAPSPKAFPFSAPRLSLRSAAGFGPAQPVCRGLSPSGALYEKVSRRVG